MNGNRILCDTNIIIQLFAGDKFLAELLQNKVCYISFITEIELQVFKKLTNTEKSKIKSFLKDTIILDINDDIKKATISFKQKYRLKIPDAIIASTAQYLDIPLLTSDTDFSKIEELNVFLYK